MSDRVPNILTFCYGAARVARQLTVERLPNNLTSRASVSASVTGKLTIEGDMQLTIARPFLLFEGNAEEAMQFYVSLFDDDKIVEVIRYASDSPGREGSVMKGTFMVAGQTLMCTDSVIHHNFTFTPAFSLFVDCDSQAQQEKLLAALSEGGSQLMPLNNYGFSRRFAWVSDRFGVSWQLNLPERRHFLHIKLVIQRITDLNFDCDIGLPPSPLT
jgi:predicted 3-demethylubiquinone-9 3-methyltransferase (glyoxalase superfamily)